MIVTFWAGMSVVMIEKSFGPKTRRLKNNKLSSMVLFTVFIATIIESIFGRSEYVNEDQR